MKKSYLFVAYYWQDGVKMEAFYNSYLSASQFLELRAKAWNQTFVGYIDGCELVLDTYCSKYFEILSFCKNDTCLTSVSVINNFTNHDEPFE